MSAASSHFVDFLGKDGGLFGVSQRGRDGVGKNHPGGAANAFDRNDVDELRRIDGGRERPGGPPGIRPGEPIFRRDFLSGFTGAKPKKDD